MSEKNKNIEELLENKKVVEKIVKVIPMYDKNKDYLAFPMEVLPKSFKKLKPKEKNFIRQVLVKTQFPDMKRFLNDKIKITLSCYLEDLSVNILDISESVISILDKITFNNSNQIKELKVEIIDVKKDSYNDGRPFIGVVVKKHKTKKEEGR
ncbi:MAG: hypothetical protein KKE50_04325 [Nanoarchaeota archaeon]|nr:hypothetical protein [Nanoarchaeota archaeon]